MLKADGREVAVRQAYNGEKALQLMRIRRPDLLLLDLTMPGMDGAQVIAEMRRDPALADVPVLLLTASSYAEDALAQRGSRMVIRRTDGLHPLEVLRCIHALLGVLEARYDERSTPEDELIAQVTVP